MTKRVSFEEAEWWFITLPTAKKKRKKKSVAFVKIISSTPMTHTDVHPNVVDQTPGQTNYASRLTSSSAWVFGNCPELRNKNHGGQGPWMCWNEKKRYGTGHNKNKVTVPAGHLTARKTNLFHGWPVIIALEQGQGREMTKLTAITYIQANKNLYRKPVRTNLAEMHNR